MMVTAAFLGVFRTLIHVPVSLIYAGHLPPERYKNTENAKRNTVPKINRTNNLIQLN